MLTHTSTAARPATSIAVSARRVTRQYGDGESAVHALRGVTLEVPVGQFTAVMGPSGSGKSTLMHLLAGLDRPTNGRVKIGDEDITEMADKQLTKLRRRHIGFVFQQFNLLPMLTAEENILLPLSIAGRKADKAAVAVADRPRRARRAPRPQAVAALRRPAAARRDRPRARLAADGAVRRRADRQPRLDLGRRGARAAARGRRARPPDHGHGHPRPARGRAAPTASCSWPTARSSTTSTRPTRSRSSRP